MEKIFTAKTYDEIKEMAAEEFGAEADDIVFETIEMPKKGLFGSKGEFRVRAIFNGTPADSSESETVRSSGSGAVIPPTPREPKGRLITEAAELEKFTPMIEYVTKILEQLGLKGYTINVRVVGDNNVIDITGDNLGVIIGRRGETLDALQYLAILVNNRGGEENTRLRLLVDCNGYREKRIETLEALTVRTSAKVIKQGRRITLDPMNPYERRIIHSKVAEIPGVFSNSVGEEPYRKVVISAEIAKRRDSSMSRDSGGRDSRGRDSGGRDFRDNRNQRGQRDRRSGRSDADVIPTRVPGEVSNVVHSKSYKSSSGFSTSFEREYKRSLSGGDDNIDISQDTVDMEKSAALYGKIEL